jgi:hypothetical protein
LYAIQTEPSDLERDIRLVRSAARRAGEPRPRPGAAVRCCCTGGETRRIDGADNDGHSVAVDKLFAAAVARRRVAGTREHRGAARRRTSARCAGQAPQFGALLGRRTTPESTPPALIAPHGRAANAVPAAAVARFGGSTSFDSGTTHMMMLGTSNLDVADVILNWTGENLPARKAAAKAKN